AMSFVENGVEHLGLDAVLYERHRSYDGNHHVAVGRGDPTVGGHPRSFHHGADIGVRVVLLRRGPAADHLADRVQPVVTLVVLEKYSRWFIGIVYIFIGGSVLIENGSIQLFINLIK